MNIKALLCFQRVVLEGSAAAAAQSLNMSQSAVSRSIGILEHELKLQLFHRTRRRLVLTNEGADFYKEAERILNNIDDIPRIAKEIRARRSHGIRLVAMPRTSVSLISPTIARFKNNNPDVHIAVDILRRYDLEKWVAGRQYDIGFGALPTSHPLITTQPLLRARAHALLPKNHRLASKKVLKPSDFLKESVIAPTQGLLPREQIDDLFRSEGHEINYEIETSSTVLACHLVGEGAGITVVDPITAGAVDHSLVVMRPLSVEKWMVFGLLLPKDSQHGSHVTSLIDILIDETKKLEQENFIELIKPIT